MILDLDKNAANYQPLTPLTFLARSAAVYPDQTAIIHGRQRTSYAQFYARCRQLASSLAKAGLRKNDTVSVLLANTPAMLECHYGVPMAGAVLNTLNTRLDAATIAFSLQHAEAKILIVDKEFSKLATESLALMQGTRPIVIDYVDPEFPSRAGAWAASTTSSSSRAAMPLSSGCGRRMSGRRFPSTTHPAPRAIPRAWSIITVAPICWPRAMC
jgi:acyl-CoA synthetase (AMP-forming)/AMP-acid ligase II